MRGERHQRAAVMGVSTLRLPGAAVLGCKNPFILKVIVVAVRPSEVRPVIHPEQIPGWKLSAALIVEIRTGKSWPTSHDRAALARPLAWCHPTQYPRCSG